jgi:hypothetical protein
MSWWINDKGEVRDLDLPGQPIVDDGKPIDDEDEDE